MSKWGFVQKKDSKKKSSSSSVSSINPFSNSDFQKKDASFPFMIIFLVFVILIVVAFATGFFKIEDFFCFVRNSGSVGVLALFFISIIANASLFFPLPIDLFLAPIAAVEFFNLGIFSPLLLGVVVATGASIGEFSGYIIGYLGITTFNKMSKKEIYQLVLLRDKLEEVGLPLLIIFAFTPLPFDVIGIAAGLAKYNMSKFFLGCWLGKVPRYVLLAYAGYFGVPFLLSFFGVPPDYLAMSCTQTVISITGV